MKTLSILIISLAAAGLTAADGGASGDRAALREQMRAVHQENQQARQECRDACRARVREALAGHPDLLAKAEARWKEIDQRIAEYRENRQERRADRREDR